MILTFAIVGFLIIEKLYQGAKKNLRKHQTCV